MEREAARQSQSEHRESSNGSQSSSASDPAPSSSSAPSPVTPTPPRLTPNPLLLDCPSAPRPTPTTCSPPPPLTPAPSLSSSHVTKTATPTSPHLLVPAPPKLTSTATPALRTYARPILPSPAKTQTAAAAAATAAASTAATTPAAPTTNTTTSSSSTASLSTKTSNTLTNGSTRTVATTTSTPITPFHTPASPPGRQVSQSLPVGTPGLARANQSAAPVRQRVSQQTLLLGKGLKGTGQDQVLLRAQMLQSLTLRPPPPGALTIPPSLRLKPPTSTSVTAAAAAPPLLSRPQTPLFPPLRPRPVTTTTESATTTASRHLSVPPPTLYSPVRAVPLRPRLLSPNGHRSPSPKQPLHPIAAAAPSSTGPSSINRPISGIKTCPLSPTLLAPGQPPTSSPCFERSPSAARQLQIIALSSGRQLQTAAGAPPQKMRANSESQTVLPLSPTLPKMSAPLPSPMTQKVDVKEKLKQESHEDRTAAKDLKVGTVDQREREKSKVVIEKEDSIEAKKPRREEKDEVMDVTEQGQSGQKMEEEKKMVDVGTEVTDQSKKGQNPEGPKDSNNETKPRISEPIALTTAVKSSPLPAQNTSSESIPAPLPLAVPVRPQIAPPPSLSTAAAATVAVPAVQNSSPVPSAVPVTSPVSVPVQEVTPNQSNQKFAELHSTNQDDNVSIQSDNQSALSSLSSQSPPSSPFVSPSADPPLPPLPPLPPPQPERPTDLRLNHKQPDQTQNNSQHREPDARPEPPNQSEDEEAEGFDQSESGHWEPRAWPEGQQVLTHLVEGFVIQEGLTPFPVNRSSLLVPEQVPKPQEVNGTNGSAALPVAPETRKPTEHSTDSEEEEEGRDTDDPNSRPSQRDRAVLHCQFCGKRGHAHNFMRSKRFCSTSCARGFNVRLTKRLRALSAGSRPERPRPVLNRAESVPGKPLLLRLPRDLWSAGRRDKEVKDKPPAAAAAAAAEEEDMELEAGPEEDDEDDGPEEEEDEDEEDDEEEEEDEPAVSMTTTPNNNNNNTVARTTTESVALHRPRRASAPAVTTTTPTTTFKPAPSQWSVEEVTAFINTLPGCGDIAEAFRVQEIDGQALLLLTEDHLMSSMNIKLGPALKICAHINTLKNP